MGKDQMFANFVEMRDFKEHIGLRGLSQYTAIASQDRQQPLRNLQIFLPQAPYRQSSGS